MPRIDPLQLLRCLSVLLSADGGIKSKDEVQRLASLMTKFSKKLVSKCIYLQILKTTKSELLGMFMGVGGWTLIHQWLSDAIIAKNLALIRELLELLLICPIEVDRLKSNNCPKLVKGLTKEGSNENVRVLASKLVERWLKVVKGQSTSVELKPQFVNSSIDSSKLGETVMSSLSESESVLGSPDVEVEVPATWVKEETVEEKVVEEAIPNSEPVLVPDEDSPRTSTEDNKVKAEETPSEGSSEEASAWDAPVGELPVYKITIRDGKQVLAKVSAGERTRTPRKQTFDSSTIKQDTPKISSSIIVKQVSDEASSSPEPVVRSSSAKLKLPKQESSADNNKTSKDLQKKLDVLTNRAPVEKRIKLIDPIREKPKENPKDKERERKERERKEKKEKEIIKLKEKKLEKAAALAAKIAAQTEKDKATLAKLVPPPISKLGKIPRKTRTEEVSKASDGKKSMTDEKKSPEHKQSPLLSPDTKKPSISVETRKPITQTTRPKTVKSFNSKFRSTGLEEEVKPPSKPIQKSSSSTEKQPPKASLKRSSPIKDALPPGKKLKAAIVELNTEEVKKTEKPGGVKYTPAKPKPSFLQESDMFMDALTASTKKEPRKRKRRTSNSKDGPEIKKEASKDETSPPGSPPSDEIVSPVVPKPVPVPKFYRDTLEPSEEEVAAAADEPVKVEAKTSETEELKSVDIVDVTKDPAILPEDAESSKSTDQKEVSSSEEAAKEEKDSKDGVAKESDSDELKGVLVHHKTRKGPKKKVSWKVEELEAVRFFDLDETERVNVTKTFMDMKQMERTNERESFIFARKLAVDDNMEEKTTWKALIPIDMQPSIVEPGKKSREKDIQYAREKIILQVLYFNRMMIPDSAIEPDLEIHPTSDPVVIPLDDVTGNPDSITDYTGTPWPDPKPMMIPNSPPPNLFAVNVPQPFIPPYAAGPPFANNPQIFAQNNIPPALMVPNGMPAGNMSSMGLGGDWRTGDGKVVSMNEMPMDMYNQGGPGIGMGMPGGMGPGPNGPMDGSMNYHMMPPEDMNQFPMQGYPMQGPPMQGPNMQGPPMQGPNMQGPNMQGLNMQGPNMQGPNMQGPPMFQGYRGGPRGPMGPRGNRGHMISRGQWHRPNGGGHNAPWQGGGGGPRQWGPKRGRICRDYAKDGFCRQGEQCSFIHHD